MRYGAANAISTQQSRPSSHGLKPKRRSAAGKRRGKEAKIYSPVLQGKLVIEIDGIAHERSQFGG